MPNWLWFLLGVATGLLWLGGSIIYLWWRVIIREKSVPPTYTEVERIVRPFGTLTIHSRRN